MLEWPTIAGSVTVIVNETLLMIVSLCMQSTRTQHAQEMFSAVDRTHLFFLADNNGGSCHILLPDFRILRAFEPIKQVSSQRAIKVNLQSRYDCRKDELVFFEAAFMEFVSTTENKLRIHLLRGWR